MLLKNKWIVIITEKINVKPRTTTKLIKTETTNTAVGSKMTLNNVIYVFPRINCEVRS